MKLFIAEISLLLSLYCKLAVEAFQVSNVLSTNHRSSHIRSIIDRHQASVEDDIEDLYDISKLQSLKFTQLDRNCEPGLLADYLMEIGATSVSVTDHDKDTENETPVFLEADGDDVDAFAAVICGDAAVGKNLWMRCDVTAHFPVSFDVLSVVDNVRAYFDLGMNPRYEVDNVPDLDWVKEVQSSWKPCVIGGFCLKFPWHNEEDVKTSIEKVGGKVEEYEELLLQGGIAFGTGEHPTTQLCLEWITTIVKDNNDIKNFLDYGAGSGVLGMAACKINPSIQSIGIEIDPDAVNIADANAEANQLNMKNYLPSDLGQDDESASLIMKAIQRASVETLPEEFDGAVFDACAANILAGPLCSLCEPIAEKLKPGAPIGLSGILEWQGEDVVEKYAEYFDNVKIEKEKNGWVLVTGTRKL